MGGSLGMYLFAVRQCPEARSRIPTATSACTDPQWLLNVATGRLLRAKTGRCRTVSANG